VRHLDFAGRDRGCAGRHPLDQRNCGRVGSKRNWARGDRALCRSGARRRRLGRGSGRARTTVPGAAALQAAAAVRNCPRSAAHGDRQGPTQQASRATTARSALMSIPCVQADHDSCGCDTDHPVPENHLLRAIEGDEAGCFRFQEADRLSGMGDLARYRLRDRLLGRKIDILNVELMLGQCHKAANPPRQAEEAPESRRPLRRRRPQHPGSPPRPRAALNDPHASRADASTYACRRLCPLRQPQENHLMERSQIFDLMGELRLYGMKAAFDEIMATAGKRQHEPQRIVGDLLTAEVNEKQARSIKYQLTIAKLPLAKDSTTPGSRIRRLTKRLCATSPAATSSPSSVMPCWSAAPAPARPIWPLQ